MGLTTTFFTVVPGALMLAGLQVALTERGVEVPLRDGLLLLFPALA